MTTQPVTPATGRTSDPPTLRAPTAWESIPEVIRFAIWLAAVATILGVIGGVIAGVYILQALALAG